MDNKPKILYNELSQLYETHYSMVSMFWDGEGYYLGQEQPNMIYCDRDDPPSFYYPASKEEKISQRLTKEEMESAKTYYRE